MSAKPTLGAYLRRGREQSGLTMEAIVAGSRIAPRLVEALEADRQDLLPAPVYVRGFIRAYCEQTGADTEEALGLYDEQAAPPPSLSIPPSTPEAPKTSLARRWGRVAALSVMGVALGIAGFALLGRRQPDAVASRGNGTVTTPSSRPAPPSAPTPAAPPVAAPIPAAPPPSAPVTTPAPTAPPVSSAPKPVERVLVMRATDTTWVRVQPDGGAATEETLAPGAVREWRSSGRFHVTLGNAGGVEIELDGRALPALGATGQVVKDATLPSESRP